MLLCIPFKQMFKVQEGHHLLLCCWRCNKCGIQTRSNSSTKLLRHRFRILTWISQILLNKQSVLKFVFWTVWDVICEQRALIWNPLPWWCTSFMWHLQTPRKEVMSEGWKWKRIDVDVHLLKYRSIKKTICDNFSLIFLATLVALHFNPVIDMVGWWYFRTSVSARLAILLIEVRSRKIGWPWQRGASCVISFLSQLGLNSVNYGWGWDFEISWQPHVHREVIFQRLVPWHGHVGQIRNQISWKYTFWSGLLTWVWWRYMHKEGNPRGSHTPSAQTDRQTPPAETWHTAASCCTKNSSGVCISFLLGWK